MERHILATVSQDQSAQYGLRFICDFFKNKEELKVTLFSTAVPPVGSSTLPSYEERAEMERLQHKRERDGLAALERARAYCLDQGFSDANVRQKMQFRKISTAMDIVQEAERGLYDAVVLGSRGLTWLEEFMANSVSKDVLDKRLTIPLWISRKPEAKRRHVLACVDDSEQALRMIDHVGYILAQEQGHDVTLLNVFDPHSGDRVFAEEIFANCEEVLRRNGVAQERIGKRMLESYSVGKAILRLAGRDNYAAVAVGRTGEDRGLMQRLFLGSVSSLLFHNLTGAGLWLCQ